MNLNMRLLSRLHCLNYVVLLAPRYCLMIIIGKSTEVATSSLSRIDILIEGEKSIIIENKVNHVLNNPLKEYWDYAIDPVIMDYSPSISMSIHESLEVATSVFTQ